MKNASWRVAPAETRLDSLLREKEILAGIAELRRTQASGQRPHKTLTQRERTFLRDFDDDLKGK
jgi:hypothetical protein